ncbi:DUF262 domain-containing protein [Deinococcus yunweiensis]|uniref:DUF262 domain-containing protein n=1 Tax=Deinococcus yunweiensis TaxID=367282 RepID=UPI00398F13B5
MDPHKFSVLDLFAKPERYVVPLYQRRYIWTEGKQWQPLWDDIQAKVDEVSQKAREDIRPHFLGAIVVAKRQTSGSSLDIYDVVDGQQRLTTFQAFLLALRDRLKDVDKPVYQRVRGHTRNGNEDLEVAEDEQYKVWPTRFDQPLFTEIWGHPDPDALVQAVKDEQAQHRPVGNLKAAYAFFSLEIKAWLDAHPEQAQVLFETLKYHLQVVRIDLHPGDDPQVIFETLNARGEPLQAADLIRNFIFQNADLKKLDVETLFQKYWAEFDEDHSFWRGLVSRGRVRRDQLTWFLTYFLTVQHGREIAEGTIFDEFKTWWRQETIPTVEARLKELQRYATAYLHLHNAPPDTRLGILKVRLDAMDTTTLTPVLLYLLTESLPAAELDALLLNLESYLVRRYVAGLTSKNNNQRFLQLLTKLQERQRTSPDTDGTVPARSAAFVRTFLSDAQGDSVRWPDDREFRRHLLTDPTYKRLKPRGVVMLLEAAEAALHSDRQEVLRFSGTSSVEHVMPRRWEKHWDAPDPQPGVEASELVMRRNTLLHNIGNLTLVTQKLNTSMSNSAYDKKKPVITKQTLRMLNAYFQDRPAWNEADIERRGAGLADTLLGIWPAPVPQAASDGAVEHDPPGPRDETTDIEKQFDRWVQEKNPHFVIEELDHEGFQGVQFIHRSWSRSWKLRVFTFEDGGEERATLEIRNDFGESDPFYERSWRVFSRLKAPLELSFADRLAEDEDGFTIELDPDASAADLEAIFDRVCDIYIPEVERELTLARAEAEPSDLNEILRLAWPKLAEGQYFLVRDMWSGQDTRRIGHASWPSAFSLTYKVIRGADGRFTLGLHDETGAAFSGKAALRTAWPALVELVKDTFPGRADQRTTSVNQFITVTVPAPHSPQDVVDDLIALIELTRPQLEDALG